MCQCMRDLFEHTTMLLVYSLKIYSNLIEVDLLINFLLRPLYVSVD